MPIADVEIVADTTRESRCDQGFLKVRRLTLRNVYDDGTRSATYPCDIVSRPHPDAAAIVLYEIDAARRVRVVLKKGLRPPVYLRKDKPGLTPDRQRYLMLVEMIAGVLEAEDGVAGVVSRASAEAWEEAGFRLEEEAVEPLGAEAFASPGVTDEKVFFYAGRVSAEEGKEPQGDGSVMEEGTEVVILELGEAIRQCRDGRIADMKTELALMRLCDALGYLPQLGMFKDQLPAGLGERHDSLGAG